MGVWSGGGQCEPDAEAVAPQWVGQGGASPADKRTCTLVHARHCILLIA